MDRRKFLRQTAGTASILAMGAWPGELVARPRVKQLTILHTNDVHSRIDPFPMDGSRNEGLGGAERRSVLIDKVRKEQPNVLLLDSGDIFQGTPFFNFFAGELEMKLMSQMGYDASTLGNHDFDAGVDGLLKQLPNATFPLINCNYDLSRTDLGNHVLPSKVFVKDDIRVGVLGVGIALQGLVPEKLTGGTQYQDPIEKANLTARFLKEEEKCDYIICLSHLGYKYRGPEIDDIKFAKASENIDLILGGHTHTFMNQPDLISNKVNQPVMINQVGWAGIMLGRIDILFEKNKKTRCINCQNGLVQ